MVMWLSLTTCNRVKVYYVGHVMVM